MSKIKTRWAGFAYIELPLVILILGLILCVVMAFVQPLRMMVRGEISLTAYEYLGTVVINLGIGLGFFILAILGMALFVIVWLSCEYFMTILFSRKKDCEINDEQKENSHE